MTQLITIIVVAHFIISVLRRGLGLPIKMVPMKYTRYLYIVVHELSHLVVGLLVGCGVYDLVLKETAESSGAYITKYKSPFKILWINFGEVFMSLAGPLLPPFLFYGLAYAVVNGLYMWIVGVVGIGLLLILAYSSQRWFFILSGLFLAFVGNFIGTDILNYLLIGLLVWGLLGMVDEVFAIRGFDNKGSDMAMLTKALFGVSHPIVSRGLYFILQGVYLVAVVVTIQLLSQYGF